MTRHTTVAVLTDTTSTIDCMLLFFFMLRIGIGVGVGGGRGDGVVIEFSIVEAGSMRVTGEIMIEAITISEISSDDMWRFRVSL